MIAPIARTHREAKRKAELTHLRAIEFQKARNVRNVFNLVHCGVIFILTLIVLAIARVLVLIVKHLIYPPSLQPSSPSVCFLLRCRSSLE